MRGSPMISPAVANARGAIGIATGVYSNGGGRGASFHHMGGGRGRGTRSWSGYVSNGGVLDNNASAQNKVVCGRNNGENIITKASLPSQDLDEEDGVEDAESANKWYNDVAL